MTLERKFNSNTKKNKILSILLFFTYTARKTQFDKRNIHRANDVLEYSSHENMWNTKEEKKNGTAKL